MTHMLTPQMMHAAIDRAFTAEDEPMIDAVQESMGTAELLELKPVWLPGDAAGMRVRRTLQKLCAAETGVSQPAKKSE